MRIAYIGQENECSIKVCNHLSQAHNITLITNQALKYEVDCTVVIDKSLWVENYFDENDFDVVIYADINDNYSLLNKWLAVANGHVKHFLIVNEDRFYSRTSGASSIESLLQKEYSRKSCSQITVINTSVLYGAVTAPPSIENIIKEIQKKNIIEVPDNFKKYCDAIHIEDFCLFLEKYLDVVEEHREHEIYVQSGYLFGAEDMLKKLKKRYPQALEMDDEETFIEQTNYDAIHLDDWTPVHSFIDDLPSVIEVVENNFSQKKKEQKINTLKLSGKILIFLLLFVIVELYTNFMAVTSDLQFVDMRMIFISLSAIVLGKNYAVSAALLCSITSVLQAISSGFKWHVIFFHVNNWIPVAIYIVFAIVIGSYADRLRKKAQKDY